jgi:hypothetical protein
MHTAEFANTIHLIKPNGFAYVSYSGHISIIFNLLTLTENEKYKADLHLSGRSHHPFEEDRLSAFGIWNKPVINAPATKVICHKFTETRSVEVTVLDLTI